MAQVGAAVLVGRRADRDEDDFGMRDGAVIVGGEQNPSSRRIAGNQLVQTRLMDGNLARVEHVDFPGVDVKAQDRVADIGKTGAGNQANVASADNGNFHKRIQY